MWPKSKRAAILQIAENQGETSSCLWLMSVAQPIGIGQFFGETHPRNSGFAKRSLDVRTKLPACYRIHIWRSKTYLTTPARQHRVCRFCVSRRSARSRASGARRSTRSNRHAGFPAGFASGRGPWGGLRRRCSHGLPVASSSAGWANLQIGPDQEQFWGSSVASPPQGSCNGYPDDRHLAFSRPHPIWQPRPHIRASMPRRR